MNDNQETNSNQDDDDDYDKRPVDRAIPLNDDCERTLKTPL